MNTTELPPLDEYVDLDTLQAGVASIYPTYDSIRWFVRCNRDALAAAGAVIIITGRMRFHPERFKQAVVEIGQQASQKAKAVRALSKAFTALGEFPDDTVII